MGSERNVFMKDERGVIAKNSGAVTTEEVIKATLTLHIPYYWYNLLNEKKISVSLS
jgi:hypothetical protein